MSKGMAVRFFRKAGDSPVPLSTGGSVKFTSVDGGLTSYFATDKAGLAEEFEKCMAEGRSALTEISEAEFHANYVSKKNSGQISRQPWREEIVQGKLRASESTLKDRLNAAQAVVGVASPPPPAAPAPSPSALSHAAVTQAAVNQTIAKELPVKEDYVPVVGKRKKAKVT
jgi:hypothetical protein